MTATLSEETVHTIDIRKEVEIAAPIEIAFEAVLEEMSDGGQMPGGVPFPMKLERRPGGRWYRDLGNDAGHLWGHVQVIRPPKLIEINGPLFMSYPAVSHLQYRLTTEGAGTRLQLTHRAMGLIPADDRAGVHEGWEFKLGRIREVAERLQNAAARR